MGGGGGATMPAVPMPDPAVQSNNKASLSADQGQRAQAAKMKGMAQAGVAGGFAGDTGGWKPTTPSLFGAPRPSTQPKPADKLGGLSLLTT